MGRISLTIGRLDVYLNSKLRWYVSKGELPR